ncbi:hypothetical protein Cni_G05623 [Canna indica]|uniref:Reverse transcriptase domain-containing protein n=1 Tax=Canna indica TaxID=4628 RepID=A0AAQ3Q3E2_9LILI|nr:hypothetical protein Cni_G05623 [Canna indica]
MIDNQISQGVIKGFKYKKLLASHLFFVDGILIFAKCNRSSCINLLKTLDQYYMTINQKVNKSKSEIIFPASCPANLKEEITIVLKIREGSHPLKYLGTFIDSKRVSSNLQNTIVEYCFVYSSKN